MKRETYRVPLAGVITCDWSFHIEELEYDFGVIDPLSASLLVCLSSLNSVIEKEQLIL